VIRLTSTFTSSFIIPHFKLHTFKHGYNFKIINNYTLFTRSPRGECTLGVFSISHRHRPHWVDLNMTREIDWDYWAAHVFFYQSMPLLRKCRAIGDSDVVTLWSGPLYSIQLVRKQVDVCPNLDPSLSPALRSAPINGCVVSSETLLRTPSAETRRGVVNGCLVEATSNGPGYFFSDVSIASSQATGLQCVNPAYYSFQTNQLKRVRHQFVSRKKVRYK